MSDSTLAREKSVFVGSLRREPVFLVQHIPVLARAVARRMRTALVLRFAAPHQGRKQWPTWLERGPIAMAAVGGQAAYSGGSLPVYPDLPRVPAVISLSATGSGDPEDYFAAHRWKFLLTSLLGAEPDCQAALNECRSWMAGHLDRSDAAWEPYSACERIAQLLVFLAVVQPGARAEFMRFVDESACWIYRHLEWYGPGEAFNHVLNNARALVMAGVATGNERSFAAGMAIFRRVLPELIGAGGFLRERSSHYQLIVLNWILDAWRFCGAHRGEHSEEAGFLRGFADRMVRAASLITGVPGPPVTIGDVSPDAPPALSIARIALLYPEVWSVPGHPPQAVEHLDGWFRAARGDDVVLLQCPSGPYPFGYLTHGHCDFTSFVWRHGPREVLTDPGRFRYTADAISMFQKSASGHNVPLVNGLAPLCETLLGNGQWWPVPYARARLDAAAHAGGIHISHNGYARATPVKLHRRQITPDEDAVVVVDSLAGSGPVELTLCWQFGPGFERFEADQMAAVSADARVELSMTGVAGPPVVESHFGAGSVGWASPEYGCRRPALAVRLRWRVELPTTVSTRFRFVPCAAS